MQRFQKLSKKVADKLAHSKVALGAAGTAVMTTASQAAVAAPDFSSNEADLVIILGAMIGFGAIVWGARKLLGFAS